MHMEHDWIIKVWTAVVDEQVVVGQFPSTTKLCQKTQGYWQ